MQLILLVKFADKSTMVRTYRQVAFSLLVLLVCLGCLGCTHDMLLYSVCMPEQRTIEIHEATQLPKAPIPNIPPPPTVTDPQPKLKERYLSLDEAIHIALKNSEVVRVLAGITAVSSGSTIYDVAISNTQIDQEQGRFDPRLDIDNRFDHLEVPRASLAPFEPEGAIITGIQTDSYNLDVGVSKTNVLGGTASITFSDKLSRFEPGLFPLNHEIQDSLTLRLDQPLLKGAGAQANLAPIIIARLNTDRSFFQFKDSMQELVRGVVEAYWAVVFARTDVWAREQQVEQGKFAYERAEARLRKEFATAGEVAQAKSAWENFKAGLVTARANLFQREAALRNIMGLPPSDDARLIPISRLKTDRMKVDWKGILTLAEEQRPDLIELKLIIEADQQLLFQARNQALPQVDAVGLYRWNGLEGRTPTNAYLSTEHGQFGEWMLGVNFSLPLGLRRDRASLRQQELNIARDYANLEQGFHAAVHDLATSVRSLDQFYEQYKAFQEARKAARINLEQQWAIYRVGGVKRDAFFLNVLQAITDWGNSVSAEAQTLAQYNTELATLERETGTILQTHGIRFYEERYGSIGPLGRLAHPKLYPQSLPPTPNISRYPNLDEPAENIFDLETPVKLRKKKSEEKK